jgi:ABC-2 type transport system permease protein
VNAQVGAVGAGVQRSWVEFRQTMTSVGELLGWLWPAVMALLVMFMLRGSRVPGTDFSLGVHAVPGILAWNFAYDGLLGMAMALTMSRDDGTLLRMKAVPNGMLGYLVGKVLGQSAMSLALLLVVLVPAAFLFPGMELARASSWLTLAWVLGLGLLAALPVGAVIGSFFKRPTSLGFVTLIFTGLVAISGVFYPATALPGWLQWVAQATPVYWLGLGVRSALLPDALAAAEIGGSWRHLETAAALAAWAVIGFSLAPVVLRRVARRTAS